MDGGGSRYRVDGVYLWALASWDVQVGVLPPAIAARSVLGLYSGCTAAGISTAAPFYAISAVAKNTVLY